jgi:hypothetical protein
VDFVTPASWTAAGREPRARAEPPPAGTLPPDDLATTAPPTSAAQTAPTAQTPPAAPDLWTPAGRTRPPASTTPASTTPASTTPASSTPAPVPEPPELWREHWFEHDQVLRLTAVDAHAAIYLDPDVPSGRTRWLLPFFSDLWQYAKAGYGPDFGPDPRLYYVFHQGRYGGGHPSGFTDPSHDHHNVSDVGAGPWDRTDRACSIPIHEVSHVVEGDNHGVEGSPAFPIWGDSKWAEFFEFDVWTALGSPFAHRRREEFTRQVDSFPRAGTYWFRDWFWPMWKDAEGPATMVRFFDLLARHFPRRHPLHYARSMNWGEYLHFSSAAAGGDLHRRAARAFGVPGPWSTAQVLPGEWLEQWERARQDFPMLRY